MLSEALVLPPHSPGCWGKVSWVVNSVRLALPFPDRKKPGQVPGDSQFPNEAKNILKWLPLWRGTWLLEMPRSFLISWHFQTSRKKPADESPILMGFWILFASAAASPFVIQRVTGIIGQAQGKKQSDCHSVSIFIIRPQPFLLGEVICFFALCVSVGSNENNYLAFLPWWSKQAFSDGKKASAALKHWESLLS